MLPFIKSGEDMKWKCALPSTHPVPGDTDDGNTARQEGGINTEFTKSEEAELNIYAKSQSQAKNDIITIKITNR
jgi:hypothetical protein